MKVKAMENEFLQKKRPIQEESLLPFIPKKNTLTLQKHQKKKNF